LDAVISDGGLSASAELRYAYVLVLAKQRRFDEAIKVSEMALRGAAGQPRMRQLRIWLLLLQNQPKLAIAELTNLATDWEQIRRQGEVPVTELAGWAGRAFGVLEGPRQGRRGNQGVDRALARWIDTVNAQERQALEFGRADVLQEFRDRLQQLQVVQQEEQVQRAQQRQDEGLQLAEQLDRVDRQLAEVREQMREVSDFYAEGRRAVEEATPGIVGAVVESDRREAWISWQVISLQSEIQRLDVLIAKEKDPAKRNHLILQRDALIAQLQWDGFHLDRAVADRFSSRAALQQAHNELVSNRTAEAREQEELALRRHQLARSQSSAQRRQERLIEPDRRISGRVRSLRRSLDAVTTYLEFPLEDERARMLRENP
jgi:hypothetical protein